MKRNVVKKIVAKGSRGMMKILPFCAIAMTVISANATACWVNGQDTPPANIKKYRKF